MRLLLAALVCVAALQGGELTRRYELTLERVLSGGEPRYTADLLTADVIPNDSRVFTNFSGDLSGRYLGALASAGRADKALELLPALLAHQRPDGSFGHPLSANGATDDDMARLWGAGRMLVGLVELYEATGDAKALDGARRLGDWLLVQAPRFNDEQVRAEFLSGRMATGYICWTQNVEGLLKLAELWPDDGRYSETAQRIAATLERRPGQHVHGWLTTLRGMVETPLLSPVARQAVAAFSLTPDLLPTGSVAEYFLPGLSRDEGCSHADWVRLNLSLAAKTGESRYLESAESALFNGFYPNQSARGGFGHRRFSQHGIEGGHEEAWWCCTLHGLRAFRDIQESVFARVGDRLRYQLPVDGVYRGAELELEADSTLEADGRVTAVVVRGQLAGLDVRQPAWSGALRFERDGQAISTVGTLDPPLAPGERLTIEYSPIDRSVDGVEYHGPWILAVPADPRAERQRLADLTWREPQVEWSFLPEGQALPIQQESRRPFGLQWVFYAALATVLLGFLLRVAVRRSR